MIYSRETKDVQDVLNTFINLKVLSRDRGAQYKRLSNKYDHITDGFHLLLNLTDRIQNFIKKRLPYRVKVAVDQQIFIKKSSIVYKNKSINLKNKAKIIKAVKKYYLENGSTRITAKVFHLSRNTIKEYLKIDENNMSYMFTRDKSSYYIIYHEFIVKRKNEKFTNKEIYDELVVYDKKVKYSALSSYIRTNQIEIDEKGTHRNNIYITNSQIIKYIFGWKLNEIKQKNIETFLLKKHPLIVELKTYFKTFRQILQQHNIGAMKKVLKHKYKSIVLNKFTESLINDYESVINTCKYHYNNSQVEGQVSKIKRIKHSMYGKAKITTLRNKTLFQSAYF